MTRLVDKTAKKPKTNFFINDIEIGNTFLNIAGPCSVESEEQIFETAKGVKEAGANILRGGAYKPRTSPYDFQGLGLKGLQFLKKAGDFYGMPIITEVVDTREVFLVCEYTDIIQIGARNMQNFALLKEVGITRKPVLLKRGMYATLSEWLNSAEYVMKEGNDKIILCERGIRTIETYTRNTLDLSAVAALKELTHLSVVVDPSHGTGRKNLLEPMSLSAIMAGADGLMIEVHNNPSVALSDKDQALTPVEYSEIMKKIKKTQSFFSKL